MAASTITIRIAADGAAAIKVLKEVSDVEQGIGRSAASPPTRWASRNRSLKK